MIGRDLECSGGQVRIPVGGAGGSRTTLGRPNGRAGRTPGLPMKRQRISPSARAALGATRPGHPSLQSDSPTCWNGPQPARPGTGNVSPTRARRVASRRSAASMPGTRWRQTSRGNCRVGGSPRSANWRYHSAQSVSSLSAR
jgi:hypothetical protein